MENDDGKYEGDDDLQLDHRRCQVHPGELAGAVVAIPPEQKVEQANTYQPSDGFWPKLRKPSDTAGEDRDRKETDDADGDGDNHALSWSAGHYSASSGRIVEGKSCGRENCQDGTQHL